MLRCGRSRKLLSSTHRRACQTTIAICARSISSCCRTRKKPLALLSSWESIHTRVKAFAMFVLALEAAMLGVFVALARPDAKRKVAHAKARMAVALRVDRRAAGPHRQVEVQLVA